MIKVLIKLMRVGTIVKLLHSLNLGWYSSRITYVLVNEIEVDMFEIFSFFIIISFLIFMVWRNPNLEAKPKKAYIILKYSFHFIVLSYIIWEGCHLEKYMKMATSLYFYGIIELVLFVLHYIARRYKNVDESPPTHQENTVIKVD